MYLRSVKIDNIRSISHFEMEFPQAAGWHVLIGDNGAGKSTIIRSIALALVGPEEALGLRADWRDWLNRESEEGAIHLSVTGDDYDQRRLMPGRKPEDLLIPNSLLFRREERNGYVKMMAAAQQENEVNPMKYNWGDGYGWFSAAYGPYRRFAGGSQEWTKVFYSQPKLGAHLSAFGEDVALTEALDWLVKLQYKSLESAQSINDDEAPEFILVQLKKLINSQGFLPHNAELESVSSEGVIFKDGNGALVNVNQLSDGYRSMLSLTFELIRQLCRVYKVPEVFKNIGEGIMNIDLPGVVLVDEIDAHLHPTWQTRIGQWFTQYFPNIQFIVTSHSPLVCRACEKGSIWRLAAPGSGNQSGEVTGIDRERLINGNVLDAYGTEIFGENVSISKEASEKTERLAALNIKSLMGQISSSEQAEMQNLKAVFPTQ
jgi:AAA domain, putative AbiEii toxin, Type IV TA system/AAA domain